MSLSFDKDNLKKSAQVLSQYLADSYYLYFKTHAFHWNVTGPHFYSLHKLFDDQYTSLFERLDDIAERIRALDCFVPASIAQFQSFSVLQDAPSSVLTEEDMISVLLKDHESVIERLRQWIVELGELNDVASQDFLTGCLADHEKMAWMLRAYLS